MYAALQRPATVTAYFLSEQLLMFAFAWQFVSVIAV